MQLCADTNFPMQSLIRRPLILLPWTPAQPGCPKDVTCLEEVVCKVWGARLPAPSASDVHIHAATVCLPQDASGADTSWLHYS